MHFVYVTFLLMEIDEELKSHNYNPRRFINIVLYFIGVMNILLRNGVWFLKFNKTSIWKVFSNFFLVKL